MARGGGRQEYRGDKRGRRDQPNRRGRFGESKPPPKLDSPDPTIFHQGHWDKGDTSASKRPHGEGTTTSTSSATYSLLSFAPRQKVRGQPNLVEPSANKNDTGRRPQKGKTLKGLVKVNMSYIKYKRTSHCYTGRHENDTIANEKESQRKMTAIKHCSLSEVVAYDIYF